MPDNPDDILSGGLIPRARTKSASGYDPDTALDLIAQHESGGRNIKQQVVPAKGGYNPSVGRVTGPSTASGPWQITDTTWRKRAPQDVARKYRTAMSAPVEVQRSVAGKIFRETGFQDWAPYNASLRKAISRGEQPAQKAQSQEPSILSGGLVAKPQAGEPDILKGGLTEAPPPQPPAPSISMVPDMGASQRMRTARPTPWGRGKVGQGVADVPAQASRGAVVSGEATPSTATQGRQLIRRVGGPLTTLLTAGAVNTNALPTEAGDYVAQGAADAAKGLLERGAGVALQAPGLPMGAGASVAERIRSGAQQIGQASAAMDADTQRAGVSVPVIGRVTTKDAQNLGSSAIATAPALALQRLGVPAPIAFGLDAYLASTGRGDELTAALKEAGLGAATGGLYEIPLPRAARTTALRAIGAKLGLGAAGGYELAKAFGVPEAEARKNAAITALFMASGAKADAPQELTQTVPEAMQGRVRLGDVRTQAEQAGATVLNPQEVIAGEKPKVRMGNADLRSEQQQPVSGTEPQPLPRTQERNVASEIQSPMVATPEGVNPDVAGTIGVRQRPLAERPTVVTQGRGASETAVRTGGIDETQTPPQPNITAQPESAEPAVLPASDPNRGPVQDVADNAPATVKPIIRHSDPRIDGGEIIGPTGDGKLKVQNNEGGVSVVKNPRTQGNREAAIVTPREERLAQVNPPAESEVTVPLTEQPTEFRKWFGKSKVADEKGDPIVVYKGMPARDEAGNAYETIDRPSEFPAFNRGEKGVKVAGFFSSDKDVANHFAKGYSGEGGSPAVFPVHLSIERPFVIDAKGEKAGVIQFGESGRKFRDAIRSGKYDGVIIKNTADEGNVYVPLKSDQIRFALSQGESRVSPQPEPKPQAEQPQAQPESVPRREFVLPKAEVTRPLAAEGLTSYRYRADRGGHIAIGAKNSAEALSEAARSLSSGKSDIANLDVWDGEKYVPVIKSPPALEELRPPQPATTEPQKPAEIPPSEGAQRESATTPVPPVATTSARKAQMTADRAELDLPELPPAERKSWRESLAQAKPERATTLADEVLTRPRALSDAETASLVVRAQQIKNDHAAVMKEIGGATDPAVIAQKRAQAAALESEFDRLTRATKASGTEKGRTLAAQKLTINQDFDLVSIKQRMKAAKGRELTADESKRYERMVAERDAAIIERDAAIERAHTAEIQKQIDKAGRQRRRSETKESLYKEAETYKGNIVAEIARLRQQSAAGQFKSTLGLGALDPDGVITRNLVKYARARVKADVGLKAEALLDEVYDLVKDSGATRRQVAELISGYKVAAPERRPADVQRLAEIRSEIQKTLGEQDVAAGVRTAQPQGPPRQLFGRNQARLKQLRAQEAELSRRLEEGDFTKPPKREPIPYTREVAAKQRAVEELERQFKREEYRATRSVGGKIGDELARAANVPKTLKSMGDISAVFRQGGYFALSHPVTGLALPLRDMVRSFSDAGWRSVEQKIKNDSQFKTLRDAGVEFTGVDKNDPALSKHEEAYLGGEYFDLIAKGKYNVPGKLIRGIEHFSERTFVSFLDAQRLYVGKKMLDGLTNPGIIARTLGAKKGLSPSELAADRQRIARAINSATGRGNLGVKGNQAAPLLNIAMFSPRLLKSRVELLNNMFNPVAWARMPRNARAQILQDNVKFLAATAAVMTIAKAAGGTVNTDPDDGDFLKIRFGDTTYDTLTGLQQPLRYLLNMQDALSGDELRLAGGITSAFGLAPNRVSTALDAAGSRRNEVYAGKSKAELTGRFARSKLSPLAGTATDYLTGSDFSGRKFSAKRAALDTITPLPAKDMIEAFQQDGLLGAVKATPTFTGVGVSTYPVAPEKPTTRAEKLTRKFIRDKMPSEGRTDEEIDRDQKLAQLRAQARQGVDVTQPLADLKARGVIDDRREKSILSSRGVTRLQEGFKRLGLREALTVYSTMSPDEQASVKKILGEKAITADLLPSDEQAAVRTQLAAYGFKPGAQIPKRPDRPQRPQRPNPRAWSYQQ